MTSYSQHRIVLMTLDPLHVGTGGYRLGRVDLSIVREPGTNLPKVPGTSLSGAIRHYAALRYGKPTCAGQGGCGKATCPICYTFGSAHGEGSAAGTVSIFDARLLLFPVHSLAGPVWVTSPGTLSDFGVSGQTVSSDKAKWSNDLTVQSRLNLGWLMLDRDDSDLPLLCLDGVPDDVRSRVVLVSDKLFAQIVNSNLEVRTSVSIDPKTGAAAQGALFTYEALPRATFLWFDLVEDDYRGAFPVTFKKARKEITQQNGERKEVYRDNEGDPLGTTWSRPLDVVRAGLVVAECLGLGGMGTRGFGRVRLQHVKEVTATHAQP